MSQNKTFQELNLSNAFLFAATMEDPDLCQDVLERILEISIRKIVVRSEGDMLVNPELRGIRLDVYAEYEENSRFNLEM